MLDNKQVHDSFLDALLKKIRERIDFRRSLKTAIQSYAEGDSRGLCEPWQRHKGLRSNRRVRQELARAIYGGPGPDVVIIAQAWEAALPVRPAICDFRVETRRLLALFTSNLRNTDSFWDRFNS